MGFELIKSHYLNNDALKINYYFLGNFGIYEEISTKEKNVDKLRFISWNPWGIDFEVRSLKQLCDAYEDSISYSPELSA
ncbi:MAG: hypothetical protein HQ491_11465 [Bacteroidetes bacterium]|nr:hypothetical protein [Bacteroidota bacterium]